jgi:chromosome segregation ATPase
MKKIFYAYKNQLQTIQMSYWNEASELASKGKGKKEVKISADELLSIKKQLEQLQDQIKTTEERVKATEEKLKTAENSLLQKDQELINKTSLLEEKEQIVEENKTQLASLAALQADLKDKESQIAVAGEQLSQFQAGIEQLQVQLVEKDQEIAKIKETLTACGTNTDEIKNLVDKKNQEIEAMRTESDNRRTEMSRLRVDIEKMTVEFKAVLQEKEEELAQFEDHAKKQEARVKDLETLLAEKETQLSELKNTITQKERQLTAIQQQNASHSQEDSEKDIQIRQLQEALENVQTELQKVQENSISAEDYNVALTQTKELQQALADQKAQFKAATEEITKITTELESVNKSNADLKQELEKLKTEISTPKSGTFTKIDSPSRVSPKIPEPISPTESAAGTAQPEPSTSKMAQDVDLGTYKYVEGRNVCPKCGSTKIKETEDRSRVIAYFGVPVYAKKYRCTRCTHEWV